MIGDIPGGTAAKATFVVRIPAGTSSGTYALPLALNYTYLASAEQIGADSIDYQYQDVHETIPLALVVRPEVVLAVTNVATESLNVGTEGYLNLTVTNAGSEPATNAIVRVARNGQSPITPVDSSAYVGAFAPGQSREPPVQGRRLLRGRGPVLPDRHRGRLRRPRRHQPLAAVP